MELGNNSVAGFETASGFMNPLVSKANVRAKFSIGLQCEGLNDTNDTNDDNRSDFSALTIKEEELPRCLLFSTSSVGSPVKRLPGNSSLT